MGAQFIKHIIWDDLATSGWKHLFPMQSNLKKFEEIWRFILLIRSLSRRCARRQNLNVVVWVQYEPSNVVVGATDCIIGNVFAIERRKYKPFPIKYHFFNNCWLLVGSNLKVRFGFEDPISRKSLSSWARRSTISAWALKLLIPDGNQTFVKFL